MKTEKQKEFLNKVYGKLTILSFNEPKIYHYKSDMKVYSVNCQCECGNLHTTDFQALKKGKVKSCGCWLSEWASKRATTHGLSSKNGKKTSEYMIWLSMKSRCNNINNSDYHHYGGRGIKICDEWMNNYSQFLKDMGERPSKNYSIERINVNGNYCKENCKWVLKTDQPKNTRKTIQITYNNKTQCLTEWCKELNLKYSMMRHRIYDLNMEFEDAIKIPLLAKVSLRGEGNSSSKLTEKNIKEIRQSNLTYAELGRIYNVAPETISSIVKRKTWKHI